MFINLCKSWKKIYQENKRVRWDGQFWRSAEPPNAGRGIHGQGRKWDGRTRSIKQENTNLGRNPNSRCTCETPWLVQDHLHQSSPLVRNKHSKMQHDCTRSRARRRGQVLRSRTGSLHCQGQHPRRLHADLYSNRKTDHQRHNQGSNRLKTQKTWSNQNQGSSLPRISKPHPPTLIMSAWDHKILKRNSMQKWWQQLSNSIGATREWKEW